MNKILRSVGRRNFVDSIVVYTPKQHSKNSLFSPTAIRPSELQTDFLHLSLSTKGIESASEIPIAAGKAINIQLGV
jgi:hypothetical protein